MPKLQTKKEKPNGAPEPSKHAPPFPMMTPDHDEPDPPDDDAEILLEGADEGDTAAEPAPGTFAARTLADGYPNPRAMDCWSYMRALTEDQWSNHTCYLYRKEPQPDKISGEPAYLEKIMQPFDQEYVKEKWGGKKFYFYLNRVRENGGGERTIYKKYFRIDAAPKFGDKELAGQIAAEGSPADKILGQLVSDLIRQRDTAHNKGQQFNPETAFAKSLEMVSQGSTAAIDMIRKQAGDAGGNTNAIMQLLLTKLLDRPDPMAGLLEKLLDRTLTPPAAADPIEQMLKLLDLQDRLKERQSSRRENSGGGWSSFAEKALERAPEILAQGKAILDSAAQAAVLRQRPAAAPGPMMPPRPAAPPTPESLAAPALAAAPVAEAEAGDAYRQQIVIDHAKATLTAMALSGDDGAAAAQMLDLVVSDYAQELRQTLLTNPATLRDDPILSRCQNAPNLPKFVREFLKYFDDEDAADAEAADDPPAVAAVPVAAMPAPA